MPEQQAADVLKQDGPAIPPVPADTDSAVPEEVGEESESQAAATSSDEHPEEKKRLGGWQRKIQKLEQEKETLLEALRAGKPAESPKPATDERPQPPKLKDFPGTIEQYQKEVDEYPEKLVAYLDVQRQKQGQAERSAQAIETFTERLNALPELDEIREQASGFSKDLLEYVEQMAAPLKNGPETVRELLLDEDWRAQLRELDRFKNGAAIAAQIYAISADLLIAKKKAGSAEKSDDAPLKTPKPPQPVTRAAAKAAIDLNDPKTPPEVWRKEFLARLEKSKQRG